MNQRIVENLGRLLAVLLVLLLLAGAGAAVYFGIDRLVQWSAGMDSSLALALLFCVTVFLSARTLAKGLAASRQTEREEWLRRRRAAIYRRLLKCCIACNEEQLSEGRATSERALLLWGSPSAIRGWLDLRHASQGGPKYAEALEAWLRAVRQDIGSRNGGLSQGDLASLIAWPPAPVGRARSMVRPT